jgi:DNA-binding IclR family transcriptional regulator
MDVKTAGRTLDLFEAFAELRRPASLSEISHQLHIPMSSCFGLVRTLENRGYLYATRARGPLYPTQRLLWLARVIAANDPLTNRVSDTLGALRDTCGETVVVGKIRNNLLMLLEVFESRHEIRYFPRVGALRPLHANSMGKALLATMPREERAAILARLDYAALTPRTLTTAAALEADIVASQRRGWYSNVKESVADLVGVALPVQINGESYGVSIVGPAHRMAPQSLPAYAAALKQACANIADVEDALPKSRA